MGSVRRGLFDVRCVDATRHRADPDHRHAYRPRYANSRRRAGRSRARQASARCIGCIRDQRQCASARALAGLRRGRCRQGSARNRKLPHRAGARRDQPRAGRPCRLQRQARTQCPLSVSRKRHCRRRDGRLGVLFFQSGDLLSHRGACHSDTHRIGADPAERDGAPCSRRQASLT